jgi:hypothetical protein
MWWKILRKSIMLERRIERYILCDISGYQSIGVIKIPKDEVN